MSSMKRGVLGIIVGGGPAPGINSAISATTIEACNSDLDVVGIYDGFEHLVQGDTSMVKRLTIADVSRIHFQGGSILRTSRVNITKDPDGLRRVVRTLQSLGINHLVLIGGDGTTTAALAISREARGAFRIAQIPKTIDNDLPLPGGMPTFGFETARQAASGMVLNLMEDSRTTERWFFIAVMGRGAGHLALGIGRATGATLTLIPEEFPEDHVSLNDVCAVLEGAVIKRLAMGRSHGTAIIAEGVSTKLDPADLHKIPGVEFEFDPNGRLRLGEIPLATILRREVQRRLEARGVKMHISDSTLGYVLRSAQPVPFDVDYTRTLGHGAVQFLLSEVKDRRLEPGGLVCLNNGYLEVTPFDDLIDPATGRARCRVVEIESLAYRVAREYMIRLERRDFEDPATLAKLAEDANTTPEEFARVFRRAVGPSVR